MPNADNESWVETQETGNVLLIVTETRLARDEGGTLWSNNQNDSSIAWARGLPAENAALTYRARPRNHADTYRLSVERSYPLPSYTGLASAFFHIPASMYALSKAVRESSVIVIRIPTLQGILAAGFAKLHDRPLAVEVVGDARQVANSGALGKVGIVLAPIAAKICQWSVRQAQAARYMTEFSLQREYPPQPGVHAIALSSVRVPSAFWGSWGEKQKGESPTVVAVGSQANLYKGHQHLIAAVAALQHDIPNLRLKLIGEGRSQGQLKDLAYRLGVKERVHFTGQISDTERLLGYLNEAWVFAMPSLTEGLPRALVEASATGIPTIGSRIGGIPELVHPDYLFPPGDVQGMANAIKKLVETPMERSRSSEYSKRTAARYSKRTAARYTDDVLSQRLALWVDAVTTLVTKARGRD